ncbi:hypothetical protein C8R45DRAFT_936465 [Mycena sanguinolenta]|nr:hypothetical protein C8R45DRAFT_936465 [Mycena sanguinolenta]
MATCYTRDFISAAFSKYIKYLPMQIGAPIHTNGYSHLHLMGAPTTFAGCTQLYMVGCTQVPCGSSLHPVMGAPSKICWVHPSTHCNSMGAPRKSCWVHPAIVNGSSQVPGKSGGSSHANSPIHGSSHPALLLQWELPPHYRRFLELSFTT